MTDLVTRAIIMDGVRNGVAAWKRGDMAAVESAIEAVVGAIRIPSASRLDRIDTVWSLLIEAHDEDPKWTAEKIVDALAEANEPCSHCGATPCCCDRTGRCEAPGCDNATDAGICSSCDQWVTDQVAAA